MTTLQTIVLSHTDPDTETLLATALQGNLGITADRIRPTRDGLHVRLAAMQSGWLIVDVDLIPVITSQLRTGRYHLIAVVPSKADPRASKLAQWGAAVMVAAEVPAYVARWIVAPTPTAPIPERFLPRDGCETVVLHSAKGGVGTSTIAAHLGSIWARQGLRVALVDLAPNGSAALLYKVQQRDKGLEQLLSRLESDPPFLESADCDLQPYLSTVLSQPGRLDLLASARPWILDRLATDDLERLLKRVGQLPYDRIIIDTSAEPTARNLAAFSHADKLLLVASPDYTCGRNLLTLKEMLDLLPLKAERYVAVNFAMAGAGMTATEYQSRLGIPVACEIPSDGQLPKLGNQGVPWDLADNSAFLQSMLALTASLERRTEVTAHG